MDSKQRRTPDPAAPAGDVPVCAAGPDFPATAGGLAAVRGEVGPVSADGKAQDSAGVDPAGDGPTVDPDADRNGDGPVFGLASETLEPDAPGLFSRLRSELADAATTFPAGAALLDGPGLVGALLDIERIARLAGFLQITAASAVDAANLAANTPERVDAGRAVFAFDTVGAPAGVPAGSASRGGSTATASAAATATGPGAGTDRSSKGGARSAFRGTAEYLQAVLGIGIRDARTRLSTGAAVLPSVTLTGVP
ncbi:MAG: hypothetical protein ACHP7K_02625, partial [Actinomycetales bacterium]